MEELRQEAIAKGVEFQKRVDHLRERRVRWEAKMRAEVAERDAEDLKLRSAFTASSTALESKWKARIDDGFDAVQAKLPPLTQTLEDWYSDFRVFVDQTVPAVIDAQSGQVTRHLLTSRETFEIDNAKLLMREERIKARYGEHVKETASLFEMEAMVRLKAHVLTEEAVAEKPALEHRTHERLVLRTLQSIVKQQKDVVAETAARRERDSSTLAAMDESVVFVQRLTLLG